MRVDITIRDLSALEAQNVLDKLRDAPVAHVAPVVTQAPPIHGMGPAPTEVFGAPVIAQSAPVVGSPVVASEPVKQAPQATVAPIVSGEVDSSGMPWDPRIHSSSRQKLAKGGGWKLRRGVDPAIVAAVEAELRGTVAAPTSPHTPAAPAVQVAPARAPVNTTPAVNNGTLTFPSLVSKIGSSISTGNLKKESVTNILGKYGLKTSIDLVNREDLWAAVNMDLDVALADPMQ
jgi:hypothetical protein